MCWSKRKKKIKDWEKNRSREEGNRWAGLCQSASCPLGSLTLGKETLVESRQHNQLQLTHHFQWKTSTGKWHLLNYFCRHASSFPSSFSSSPSFSFTFSFSLFFFFFLLCCSVFLQLHRTFCWLWWWWVLFQFGHCAVFALMNFSFDWLLFWLYNIIIFF